MERRGEERRRAERIICGYEKIGEEWTGEECGGQLKNGEERR